MIITRHTQRLKRAICSSILLLETVLLYASQPATVPQTLTNPYPIDPTTYSQLIAMGGAYSDTLKEKTPDSNFDAKQFWLTQWASVDQSISWRITTLRSGDYRIVLLIDSGEGEKIKVSADSSEFVYTTKESGWQRVTTEQCLALNEGVNTISVSLAETPQKPLNIKSIELYDVKEEAAINQRVADFKGDVSWLKDCGYGIMTQTGGWSYPQSGDKKPWPGFAEDFDAKAFVQKVDEMGGKFLVWSVTWYSYYFPAPIKAIAEILPDRVSKRDLIRDLIKECKKRDIRFMIYYHSGHGERDVFEAKGWHDNWITEGGRDRSVWLEHEYNIFTEVGKRYGKDLDGIFIDGCLVWYPADFERLGQAFKAGNPDRVIGYNSWIVSQYTPFQDFYAGEGFNGAKTPWSLDDGVIAEGPQEGLQCWGCSVFDGPGWGVYKPNVDVLSPKADAESLIERVKKLESEHYSVALNIILYEDGSVGQESYDVLTTVAKELGRGVWSKRR